MSFSKSYTGINWVLISVYGAFVLWYILQQSNPYTDAGGGDMETAIKGLVVFLLFVLNLLSYSRTKVVALLLVVLFLLLIRYITTH